MTQWTSAGLLQWTSPEAQSLRDAVLQNVPGIDVTTQAPPIHLPLSTAQHCGEDPGGAAEAAIALHLRARGSSEGSMI